MLPIDSNREPLAETIADLGKAWEDRDHPAGRHLSGWHWDRVGEYIAERLIDEGVIRDGIR